MNENTSDEDLTRRALAACEDEGKCQWRDGPDDWCNSCILVHLI